MFGPEFGDRKIERLRKAGIAYSDSPYLESECRKTLVCDSVVTYIDLLGENPSIERGQVAYVIYRSNYCVLRWKDGRDTDALYQELTVHSDE